MTKMMTFSMLDGQFNLWLGEQKTCIGDYIEAEFMRHLGVVDTVPDRHGRVRPVFGILMKLTLSANIGSEVVTFMSGSNLALPLFNGPQPGDKLVIRNCEVKIKGRKWYQLVLNGLWIGLLGVISAPAVKA